MKIAKLFEIEKKDIVTICMYCKKIKDSKGNWIKNKTTSNVNLSHGMCSECKKIHHPNL